MDNNKLAEMHKSQLRETLNMLLSRADEIVGQGYKNDALDVKISIEINPEECVTYSINYRYFAKERGFFNDREVNNGKKEN